MSSIIKIKRSSFSTAPSSLFEGELAYSYGAGAQNNGGDRLYFGNGTTVDVIGGKYFTNLLDHIPGTLTASSALLVDSNSKVDNFKVDNLDFDSNTISSTNTDGAVVLNPNGNGKVEFDFANNAAAFARITGATATQYKDNIITAADSNAIPNKQYVDDAITSIGGGEMDIQSADDASTATLNFVNEPLEFDGVNGLTFTVAEVFQSGSTGPKKVKITATLTQNLEPTSAVEFASVKVDDITINNNTISAASITTDPNLTLTADGNINLTATGEVVANSLTVSDLTATRVVFAGTNGALVDNVNFTFTAGSGKLDVTGELEVDNVSINGNTIGTVDTNGKLTLAPNGTGVVEIDSNALTTTETSFNLVNTTATTVNFAGAATALSIGAATGTTTINNTNTVVTGDLAVNGGDLTTTATTFNLINTTATTVNFAQGAGSINIGSSTSTVTFGDDVVITGDLTVNGTTTTVNSTTLTVDDPFIKLADGNTANTLDIGFYGQYNTTSFTGLFRDASDSNKYKLFATGTVTNNVVDTNPLNGFTLANLLVGTIEGTIDGGTY